MFFLSLVFPKNKKTWLYGAWFGERYADNSKALFEYSSNLNDEINHFWVYKNFEIKKELDALGYKSVYVYSIKGILLQLKAKVFITSVNSSDFIPFCITPRNIFIQLWHGSPLKHIGIQSRKSAFRRITDKIRFKLLDKYTYITSPAKVFDKIFQDAFFMGSKVILRSGYPRNESLITNVATNKKIRNYFEIKEDEKLIAYLPTHRNEGVGESPFKSILIDLISKNQTLQENKIKILVKPHFYEKDSLKGIEDTSNVKIIYDFPFDLYEFLGASDMLITDYSSVMFDYELTNKNILIFPFDFESYTKKDRGLYFTFDYIYNNLLNAKRVNTLEQLIKEIIESQSAQKDDQNKSIFNMPMTQYSEIIYSTILNKLY